MHVGNWAVVVQHVMSRVDFLRNHLTMTFLNNDEKTSVDKLTFTIFMMTGSKTSKRGLGNFFPLRAILMHIISLACLTKLPT